MDTNQITEELEKLTASATGVAISLLFGEKVGFFGQSIMFSPASFLVEMCTKAVIAVVSGALTYLAIHYLKKALKHDK